MLRDLRACIYRIADREISLQRGEIERQHAGMMVDIQQHHCASRVCLADKRIQFRHDLAGTEQHRGEHDEVGLLRQRGQDCLGAWRHYR